MILLYLLIAALVGPVILGAVAVQQPRDLHQMVLMGTAILLSLLLAVAQWFFERLAEHGLRFVRLDQQRRSGHLAGLKHVVPAAAGQLRSGVLRQEDWPALINEGM